MPRGDKGNACGAMDPGLRRDDGRGGGVTSIYITFPFLEKNANKRTEAPVTLGGSGVFSLCHPVVRGAHSLCRPAA